MSKVTCREPATGTSMRTWLACGPDSQLDAVPLRSAAASAWAASIWNGVVLPSALCRLRSTVKL